MLRTASFCLLLLLVLTVFPAAEAKAAPQYYETTLLEDTEGDLTAVESSGGFLDIVNVYVGEGHGYDGNKQQDLGDFLAIRFESANANVYCGVTSRLEITLDAGSGPQAFYADVYGGTPVPGDYTCAPAIAGGSTTVSRIGTSTILTAPYAMLGVARGATIGGIWARSLIVEQASTFDVVPLDNQQRPGPDTPPTEGLGEYVTNGPYPFFQVTPTTPTAQYSVNGQEVKYEFEFLTVPERPEDGMRIRFDAPEGWSVSPSAGRTGIDPEGQFSTISGVPREFFFKASATNVVENGDVVPITMRAYSDSGGYVEIVTLTTVSGSKVTDPELVLNLTSGGPFKAKTDTPIRFKASHPTIDIAAETLNIDVFAGARKLTTLTAKPMGAGEFELVYSFPEEGEYRLDVYISSMTPSPHQEFTVLVKGGGLSPGPGPLLVFLALLVGAAGYLRRNR